MKAFAPAPKPQQSSTVVPQRRQSSRSFEPSVTDAGATLAEARPDVGSLHRTMATMARSPRVRQLARQKVLINDRPLLSVKRRQLNAGAGRGVQRRANLAEDALLQAKFEDGTYADSAARGYVLIVGKAAGSDYLLLETQSTRGRQVISKGSREYKHLRRSPGMAGYTITDAQGAIYTVRTYGDIPSQILTLEEDLRDTPHLTWSMRQAKDDVATARAIVAFLTPLEDGPVLELAKSQLQDAKTDVPVAQVRTTFLANYLDAGKPTWDLAVAQLREAKDDVGRATRRTEFLRTYLQDEQAVFDLAKAQLQSTNDDVVLAGRQMQYLLPHWTSGTEAFDIARRELLRAGGDPDKAQAKMGSFSELFRWAGEAAEKEGAQSLELAKSKAELAETTSQQEALSKAGFTRTALKRGKLPKGRKTEEYQAALKLAAETRSQAVASAEIQSETVKAGARARNVGFVGEVTAGALEASTVQWLMQRARDDQKVVRALQAMMERQADPNDRRLAEMALTKSEGPVSETAAICQSLLERKAPGENAMLAALFCVKVSDDKAQRWVQDAATQPKNALQAHIAYLSENGSHIGKALLVLQTCGLDGVIYEMRPLLSQPLVRVQWLLTYFGSPHFQPMINLLTSREEKIEVLQALIAFNVLHQNFAMADLLTMAGTYSAGKLLIVLQDTLYVQGAEVHPKFVQLYVGWGGTPASQVQFLYLIRLQAILETLPATVLTVFQADANYARSHNPPSRTGFVHYTFANGDRAVIHTHWNQNDKKLVSMHIQSGGNGVEINTWAHFKRVMEAVRDAHNAAVGGGFGPTTIPAGGQLTL